MKLTIHTKLKLDSSQLKAFADTALHYNKVKRNLYSDVASKKRSPASFKNEYLPKYGITARQFNAIRVDLGGTIDSRKELQKLDLARLKEKEKSLKKDIKRKQKKLKKEMDCTKKEKLKNAIHQKKRKLASISQELIDLKTDIKNGIIRLCFGSKKLFSKQFHLEENGYDNHAEWKNDWIKARNSSFFFLGSKDESCGNQNCQLSQNGSLKIRVPNFLIEKHGKYITLENITFSYKQDQLQLALKQGQALTHRFVQKDDNWYLHTCFEHEEVKAITLPPLDIGAIGVDFNASNVATAETDRFGNLIGAKTYTTNVRDKRKDQTLAIYGDCSKQIVEQAFKANKAIIVENLDFTKKRSALKECGRKYARMLSSFAYNSFLSILKRRAYTKGVKVYEVNPAYTSIIGKVKFMGRYGISPHESAAFCIARRISNYSEKIPSESASLSLAKMTGQHVWRKWSFILRSKVGGGGHHVFYNWRSLQDAAGLSIKSLDEIFCYKRQKACGAR